ncbi:MspA family porin [Mycolicibacterium fluoranthenivorans]|jgi:hypothetical protein|uniref:MspA family porin n=2 Tax=Mycobacteriaceae TaxID=1762 RepID=A0A1G4VM80_9MYCO|nr:MspA family porin [Mycobacterium hackensackense]QNJ92507.1 MspA family porin [Mycolicibacterium fluoranthenivorans]SCX08904.1 MspA protein [Mycolicibacterium fluoranthenivorans]
MPLLSRVFRTAAGTSAASVVLLCATAGVAQAEQLNVPSLVRTTDTVDGWRMTLALTDAQINGVPNMASAPFAREAFLSARVSLTIDGSGTAPIRDGQVVFGAQLGCQVDLSDGLDLGVGLDTDLFDDDSVVGIGPDIGSTIYPGGISVVALGAKSLKGQSATVSVLDAHVQVDKCGGAVTLRLFASAQTKTDSSDDSVNVYSEIVPL